MTPVQGKVQLLPRRCSPVVDRRLWLLEKGRLSRGGGRSFDGTSKGCSWGEGIDSGGGRMGTRIGNFRTLGVSWTWRWCSKVSESMQSNGDPLSVGLYASPKPSTDQGSRTTSAPTGKTSGEDMCLTSPEIPCRYHVCKGAIDVKRFLLRFPSPHEDAAGPSVAGRQPRHSFRQHRPRYTHTRGDVSTTGACRRIRPRPPLQALRLLHARPSIQMHSKWEFAGQLGLGRPGVPTLHML